MAIVKEFYNTRKDGVKMYRIYSDKGYEIRKLNTDEFYSEVINSENSIHEYEYEETTEKINSEEELTETELKAQAYDILVGEVE